MFNQMTLQVPNGFNRIRAEVALKFRFGLVQSLMTYQTLHLIAPEAAHGALQP